MKRFALIWIAAQWCLASCAPVVFQQIATLSSENVEFKSDGTFIYEDPILSVKYNFWSESGKFDFIVTNKTDDNLYLDLSESYFINNGYAYDYYRARTFVTVHSSAGNSSNAVAWLSNAVNTDTSASYSGGYVEYAERPLVCIPAHSSKVFEEFSVASSVFRECGFIRDPSRRETAVKVYNALTSPRVIENRLVFRLCDITLPITNVFYVSKFQNIAYDNATEYMKVENCDGTKRDVKVHKMAADNRFYITYDKGDMWVPGVSETDRTGASSVKSVKGNFNDGIYR